MICLSTPPNWRARLQRALGSLLALAIIGTACSTDGTTLSTEAALPLDSTATAPADTTAIPGDTTTSLPGDTTTTPPDSTVPPPADTSATGETFIPTTDLSSLPGITFGSTQLQPSALNTVHTGTLLGGPLSPSNIISVLTTTQNKRGRIVIKLCKGSDHYVKNSDGTFSFAKWKALIDKYRTIKLGPFIADGTILGHYLIDEPHRAVRWGGKIIPQSTIEAMAAYSKQIWPDMPTMVRVVPSWLATSSITYRNLDAAWFQYTAKKGDVTRLVTDEVAAAKRKGLGLVVGMNVMAGGNGTSGIRGQPSGWAMSATELRKYGTALLNQSYVCGFYNVFYTSTYYGRLDIRSAMGDLSAKAKLHAKTSCRQ